MSKTQQTSPNAQARTLLEIFQTYVRKSHLPNFSSWPHRCRFHDATEEGGSWFEVVDDRPLKGCRWRWWKCWWSLTYPDPQWNWTRIRQGEGEAFAISFQVAKRKNNDGIVYVVFPTWSFNGFSRCWMDLGGGRAIYVSQDIVSIPFLSPPFFFYPFFPRNPSSTLGIRWILAHSWQAVVRTTVPSFVLQVGDNN